MTEREKFVAWLERLYPPLPTTHDVEVAWRAWQARAEWASDLLKAYWEDFTDCKPVPDGFPQCLEGAGLVEFRRVTRDDLKQSGAEDRGIEKGGMCWSLTASGEAAFSATPVT